MFVFNKWRFGFYVCIFVFKQIQNHKLKQDGNW